MFDLGGSFGIDLGAMGEGGGFFGDGVPDPGADAFRRANKGQLSLQRQSNSVTREHDRLSFADKMALAEQFGINKLSMLGVSSSGGSPYLGSTGSANFSSQASHSVKADPQESEILNNNVKISSANARQAEANATLAEMDVKARSAAALSTGRPPGARISNDKTDSILKNFKVNGHDFKLANPASLPEQYNYGEVFTALVNSGVDPRLALSLSAINLGQPTSWVAPYLTHQQLKREEELNQAAVERDLEARGMKKYRVGGVEFWSKKGGK